MFCSPNTFVAVKLVHALSRLAKEPAVIFSSQL